MEPEIQFALLTSMLPSGRCNLGSSLKQEPSVPEESSQIWEACTAAPSVSSWTLAGQTVNSKKTNCELHLIQKDFNVDRGFYKMRIN